MQEPPRQPGGKPSVEIRRSPSSVVAVQPDRDFAVEAQELRQPIKGRLRVRRVVQNSDAVDEIESPLTKRKLENVCLRDVHVWALADIALSCIHRATEIDAHDYRDPARSHVSETAHSAAYVQHPLAAEHLRRETGFRAECALRLIAARSIQLRIGVNIPFESKVLHVKLALDEPGYAANDREAVAGLAVQRPRLDLFDRMAICQGERAAALWASKDFNELGLHSTSTVDRLDRQLRYRAGYVAGAAPGGLRRRAVRRSPMQHLVVDSLGRANHALRRELARNPGSAAGAHRPSFVGVLDHPEDCGGHRRSVAIRH